MLWDSDAEILKTTSYGKIKEIISLDLDPSLTNCSGYIFK